jgi:Tfp pilus assembly protein PilX
MKGRSNGMVLLTTLMMIGWIAWMVLSAMRAALLLSQVNQQMASNHQHFYALEAAAQAIVQQATAGRLAACADQSQGECVCTFTHKQHKYCYGVVDFGLFPCFLISSEEGGIASHHWELTVKRSRTATAALRIRVAMREPSGRCESSRIVRISEGVMSWRYLAEDKAQDALFA